MLPGKPFRRPRFACSEKNLGKPRRASPRFGLSGAVEFHPSARYRLSSVFSMNPMTITPPVHLLPCSPFPLRRAPELRESAKDVNPRRSHLARPPLLVAFRPRCRAPSENYPALLVTDASSAPPTALVILLGLGKKQLSLVLASLERGSELRDTDALRVNIPSRLECFCHAVACCSNKMMPGVPLRRERRRLRREIREVGELNFACPSLASSDLSHDHARSLHPCEDPQDGLAARLRPGERPARRLSSSARTQ